MSISRIATAVLFISLLVGISTSAWSDDSSWEYQVVILKGITAGGTIEKKSSGIYVDKKKTDAISILAADGWEVISVVGAPGADDTAYLRRQRGQ